MADKDNEKSAVVAGKSAATNPHLQRFIDQIVASYKPNRAGKSNRQMRVDHTAMIPNDKPIYGYKTKGDERYVQLLFPAGWYLSPEENYIKEAILADPETKKLNEDVWDAMRKQGVEVEKEAPELADAKVVA